MLVKGIKETLVLEFKGIADLEQNCLNVLQKYDLSKLNYLHSTTVHSETSAYHSVVSIT